MVRLHVLLDLIVQVFFSFLGLLLLIGELGVMSLPEVSLFLLVLLYQIFLHLRI